MSARQPSAADSGHANESDNSNMFPVTPISNDASTYFGTLLSSTSPRADAPSLLAGPVATYMLDQDDPQVAALYLQAVARHLMPEDLNETTKNPERNEEARQRLEILQAVGQAATKCTPRSTISQSGILPALIRLIPSPSSILSVAHVELLQCSLLAGQYRFIRRMLAEEWPRPTGGISIEHVLRYFYYRGMVHMGCDEFLLAIRCFWTCVTIPSEVISAITIAAWKKMVLCQCLLQPAAQNKPKAPGGQQASPQQQLPSILTLPAASSATVARFFSVTSTARPSATSDSAVDAEQQQQNHFGIRAYFDLVKAFCQGDYTLFSTVKQSNANLWETDGNTGMVNRVEIDLQRRQVYHLSRVYSVIPLSQLCVELQLPPEQVQNLLLQLSAKGMAIEVEADGMVSFPNKEIPEHGGLEQNFEQVMALAERIRQLDVAVATIPRYQHLTRKDRGEGSRGAAAPPRGVADL